MTRPDVVVELVDDATGAAVETSRVATMVQVVEREVGWGVTATARLTTGSAVRGRLRVSVSFPAADPWWLVPGAFYGENCPADNDRPYPRFEVGAAAGSGAAGMTSSWWELRADRAATVLVCGWGDDDGIGLAADETTGLGMTGLGFAHDEGRATVWLSFPYAEGPISYYGDDAPRPAVRESFTFEPGHEVTVSWRVFALGPDRGDHAAVVRARYAETADRTPETPWVEVPEAARLAAHGLHEWHYDPDPGVLLETIGFDRGVTGQDGRPVDRQAMHVAWISGIPWAYALLRHAARVERADYREAAEKVVRFVCDARSPSGFLWGVWYRERGWAKSWTPIERGLHSRTLAEAILFAGRSIPLLGDDLRAQVTATVRRNLDLVVARQRADGCLGSVFDAETGEVLSWRGASGLTWVAALAEQAALDPRYAEAAVRAGAYYTRFVEAEYLHGAPEDVDLAPTSEDGYAAILAYVALARLTGDERWVDVAARAADWTMTFRYSYDVGFAPGTLLAQYDFRSLGADQASPSNQHLHSYGLVCHDELRWLAARRHDDYLARRAEDTLRCFRQFVARFDGDFNAYRGMVSERFYQTHCFQPKGMLLTLSHAWCVGVLLLACEDELASSGPTAGIASGPGGHSGSDPTKCGRGAPSATAQL
ncbi:hypothetical protein ACFQ8T_06780 [Isoptericola sp. NPDC056618]|uniref:hypothetical protein n=1 Tax=Isoptericola sp. NPDC056618 TaxID=3345878 RepID=UPI00367AC73E